MTTENSNIKEKEPTIYVVKETVKRHCDLCNKTSIPPAMVHAFREQSKIWEPRRNGCSSCLTKMVQEENVILAPG